MSQGDAGCVRALREGGGGGGEEITSLAPKGQAGVCLPARLLCTSLDKSIWVITSKSVRITKIVYYDEITNTSSRKKKKKDFFENTRLPTTNLMQDLGSP